MAKKKKRNWIEEQERVKSRADRLLNQKGSYEDRASDLSSIRDESVQSMNATSAESSSGNKFKITQDSKINDRRYSDLYDSYIVNKMSRTFNGQDIPVSALKDFKSAATFLQSKGIKTDDLLDPNEYRKQYDTNIDKKNRLNEMIDKAQGLNIGKTTKLVRQSLNDIDAVKKLATQRKGAEGLLKLVNDYRKEYGDSPELKVIEDRAKGISDYIAKNAKGGSAATNAAFEENKAPYTKSPYDTSNTLTKDQVKAKYQMISDENLEEKYGKPGNIGYEGLKKIKPETQAEEEWVERNKWNQSNKEYLKKDYAKANEEIITLQQERDELDKPEPVDPQHHSNTGADEVERQANKKREAEKEKRRTQIDNRLKELTTFRDKYYTLYGVQDEMKRYEKSSGKEIADLLATKYDKPSDPTRNYENIEKEYLTSLLLDKDDAEETYNYIDDKLHNDYLKRTYPNWDKGDGSDPKDADQDEYTAYRSLQLQLAAKIGGDLTDEIRTDVALSEDTDIQDKYKAKLAKFGERLGNDIYEAAKRQAEGDISRVEQQEATEEGKESPIATIPEGVWKRNTGGLEAFFDSLGQRWNTTFNQSESGLDPVDFNSDAYRRLKYGQSLQEGGASEIDNEHAKSMYNAVNSTADMALATLESSPLLLTNLVAPGAGTKLTQDAVVFIMGTQAGASSMLEAHEQGMSDREAVQYGLASAFNETLGEKISIDQILKVSGGLKRGLKNFVKTAGKSLGASAVAEGSEEVATDLLNRLYDNMAHNKDSLYNRQIKEYQKQGLTKNAAKQKVDEEFISQLGQDFEAGALAGLLMGGSVSSVNTAINKIQDAKTTRDVGSIINNNLEQGNLSDEDLDYMTEVGMKSSVPEINEQAIKIKDKIDNGQSISNMEIGSLSRDLIAANEGLEVETPTVSTPQSILEQSNLPKDAKETMISKYPGDEVITPRMYENDYRRFYTLGKSGNYNDIGEVFNYMPEYRDVANNMTPDAAGVAFQSGLDTYKSGAKLEQIDLNVKPTGKVVNDIQDDTIVPYTKDKAKRTGLDFYITDDIPKYLGENSKSLSGEVEGFTRLAKGRVFVNPKVGNALTTIEHEIAENIKNLIPEQFAPLEKFMVTKGYKVLGTEKFEDVINNYKNAYPNSNDTELRKEYVCDMFATLMTSDKGIELFNENNIEEATKGMTKDEKKSFIEVVKEVLSELVTKLKAYMESKGVKPGTEFVTDETTEGIADIKTVEDAIQYGIDLYDELKAKIDETTVSEGSVDNDVQYSLSQIQDEYQQAFEEKDEKKAAELVKEYAAKKGYTQKVYHGTQYDFGFTQIDTSKAKEASGTFWATDDLKTAETYSENKGVRKITKARNLDIKNLSNEQLAKEGRKTKVIKDLYYFKPGDYNERLKALNQANRELVKNIKKVLDKRSLDKTRTAFEKYQTFYNKFVENQKAKKGELEGNTLYTQVRDLDNTISKDPLIDITDSSKIDISAIEKLTGFFGKYRINDDTFYGYGRELDRENAEWHLSRGGINGGNYQFYANTKGFMEVDADGAEYLEIPTDNIKLVDHYKDDLVLTSSQLALNAKEQGYDGLVIKDLADNGMRGDNFYDAVSDVYVFFNPTAQVKSADPFTYDDNGDLIPLDKRFNKNFDDIRYSMANEGRPLSEIDSEGNELSKEQQDYFKDSKVRDEEGNLLVMYHGTPQGNFTIFNKGMNYFTPFKEYAEEYKNPGASAVNTRKQTTAPKVYEVYLNITKPFDIRIPEVKDIFINEYVKGGYAQGINPYEEYKDTTNSGALDWVEVDNVYEWLEETGRLKEYDGIIADEGGVLSESGEVNYSGLSYITFNSNQAKNIDNKQPTTNEDIRYSKDERKELQKEINKLKRENDKYKYAYEMLEREFKRTNKDHKISSTDINKTSNKLKSELGSTIPYRTLNKSINRLYTEIYNRGNNIQNSDINAMARSIIRDMLDYVEVKNDVGRGVLEQIKGSEFRLSQAQKNEIAYKYGDFNKWRNKHKSYFTVSDDAKSSIDQMWYDEWLSDANPYANVFAENGGEELSDKDIAIRLTEIIDNAINPSTTALEEQFNMTEEDIISTYALELLNEYITTPESQTLTDTIWELKQEQKDAWRRAYKEGRAQGLAERRAENLVEREKRREAKLNKDVKAVWDKIQNQVVEPTFKDKGHLTPGWAKAVAEFSQVIDFENAHSRDWYITRINNATQAYENAVRNDTPDKEQLKQNLNKWESMFENFNQRAAAKAKALSNLLDTEQDGTVENEVLKTRLDDFIASVDSEEGIPYYRLSMDQKQDLLTLGRMILHENEKQNRIRGKYKFIDRAGNVVADVSDLVAQANEEAMDTKKPKSKNPFRTFFNSLYTPQTVFDSLGGNHKDNIMLQLWQMVDDAQEDEWEYQKQTLEILDPVLKETDKGNRLRAELEQRYNNKNLVDIGVKGKDADGNEVDVKLPRGMVLELLTHISKPQNLKHIAEGGLTVPDFKGYYNADWSKAYGSGQVLVSGISDSLEQFNIRIAQALEDGNTELAERLSDEKYDLQQWATNEWLKVYNRLKGELTEYESRVLDAMEKTYQKSGALMGEVSNAMYGVNLFDEINGVADYYPISVDPAYLGSEIDYGANVEANLGASGFAQKRVNSKKPLLLGDIFVTTSNHLNKTSKYYAYLIPQHNMNAVLNGQVNGYENNLKKTLQLRDEGKLEYIETWKKDMFGGRGKDYDAIGKGTGKAMSWLRSNYAAATLNLNAKVALYQPLSYFMALTSGGAKNTIKGLVNAKQSDLTEMINEATNMLWARDYKGGMVETETLKANKSALAKAIRWADRTTNGHLDWIHNRDIATVTRLGGVAKAVLEEEGITPETEEWNEEFARVYKDLMRTGQPQAMTAMRPEIQRSNSEIVKFIAMFYTVRLQMLNTCIHEVSQYKQFKQDYKNGKYGVTEADVKEQKGRAVRAIVGTILSQAAVVAVAALIQALLYHQVWDIKDEDGEVTPESIVKGFGKAYSKTMAEMIPLAGEIYDTVDYYIQKSSGGYADYDGLQLNGLDVLTDLVKNAVDTAVKLKNNNLTSKDILKEIEYLGKVVGVPLGNIMKPITGGLMGAIEDANDNGAFDFSDLQTDSQRLNLYFKDELSDEESKQVLSNTTSQKITSAAKKLYQDGTIDAQTAIDKMKQTGLFDKKERKQPTDSYLQGKIEWWNIEQKYKDDYIDSLDDNGNITDETKKIISQIAKEPYSNAFWTSPKVKTTWKSYKSPYEKLYNKVTNWKKTE